MARSKTVSERMDNLYATLATVAARRAVHAARTETVYNAIDDANAWAEAAGEWLDKSSAAAARWTYSPPGPATPVS